MIGQARLFLETVRHLRPEQIYGRAWHRLSRPTPDLRPAPARRALVGQWAQPALKRQSLIGPDRFQFLNHTGDIAQASDWNRDGEDKLWLYNLHYFDDLNAATANDRLTWHRALVERWIAENPPATGNGWEPYPVSLRIVNWIKWGLGGTPLSGAWQDSLAVQTRWLAKRLEHHLLGNHLFANAKALVFAGCYFSGAEADGWLRTGLDILKRELAEQVLADGGHFERSPMYHAIILEDVLDLINLADAYSLDEASKVTAQLREAAPKMLFWLDAMCHPDGQISFFNDAAFGIAPSAHALQTYARRCTVPLPKADVQTLLSLRDSGYIRLANDLCVALLDTAPIGPDYLPGHAHADTLSFELSLFGQRLIVNGGTSVYGTGPERQRQRSTATHSTVEIDGLSSSEVWAGFRVARRANPLDLRCEQANGGVEVSCGHDGYHRLPGAPTHRRSWRLEERSFRIVDRVDGAYGSATARLPLAPGCLSHLCAGGNGHVGTIQTSDGHHVAWQSSAPAKIVETTWHPEFGVSVPNSTLAFPVLDGQLTFELNW